MKKYLLLLLLVASTIHVRAQAKKYISLGLGVNQSTFLLDPGFFSEGELERMWGPKLYPSPELAIQYNIDLNNQNTLAIAAVAIYYQRIISLALPITLRYDFRFTEKKKCPFIRLNGGYSLFLTNGVYYGMGAGYQFGNLKASLTYNNQFRNNSILEDNSFIAARIASMSLKFEYALRKKDRQRKY